MENFVKSIYDSFDFINWYNRGADEYYLVFSFINSDKVYGSIKDLLNREDGISIKEIEEQTHSRVIPVGGIRFIESYLGKPIKAINIPKELRGREFTGREVCEGNKETLDKLTEKYKELFIKDAKHCKQFEPVIYSKTYTGDVPDDIFMSEILNIDAEYRAFVYRGVLLDARRYACSVLAGSDGKLDTDLIRKAISTWKTQPTAFTLDFAVTSDGRTVLIEAHNFLGCGLYGLDETSSLAYMTIAAYEHELNN